MLARLVYFLIKFYLQLTQFFVSVEDIEFSQVLAPTLFLIFTADFSISTDTSIATFADDTYIITANKDPSTASRILQYYFYIAEKWFSLWRKVNSTKYMNIRFTICNQTCPAAELNDTVTPSKESVKYIRIHLDRTLN